MYRAELANLDPSARKEPRANRLTFQTNWYVVWPETRAIEESRAGRDLPDPGVSADRPANRVFPVSPAPRATKEPVVSLASTESPARPVLPDTRAKRATRSGASLVCPVSTALKESPVSAVSKASREHPVRMHCFWMALETVAHWFIFCSHLPTSEHYTSRGSQR